MTSTQYTEDEVRQLFAAATEDMPPGLDVLAGFQDRSRARRRPRPRILLAAGAMASTAAAAIALTLTAGPAPSAMAQLTRAAATTSKQSYQITSHVATVGQSGSPVPVITIYGAFDPVRNVGLETSSDGLNARYANGYIYLPLPEAYRQLYLHLHHTPLPPGKAWVRFAQPLRPARGPLGVEFALQGSTAQSLQELNPQSLLTMLQSATRVHQTGPASGPGWTGTQYSFSASATLSQGSRNAITLSTRGTVDVDQPGRVRSLTATETIHIAHPPRGTAATTVRSIDVTFKGFGLPVSVTLPPASQVFIPPNH
jgi:hypothetical protein